MSRTRLEMMAGRSTGYVALIYIGLGKKEEALEWLAVGAALAVAAGKTAEAMLFGLKPNDPLTIGLAVAGLAAVALAASYLPARRAAALDPMAALREE
jgi:ABC-type antimicrobial peptide transport system permease subunit